MFYAIIQNSAVVRRFEDSQALDSDYQLNEGEVLIPYRHPIIVKMRSGSVLVGIIRDQSFISNDKREHRLSAIEKWMPIDWLSF